jgi:hypothetical protein
MDREHDPVAEAVVTLASLTRDHETRGLELARVVVVEGLGKRLPGVGRIADPETGRDLAGQPAALQVVDGVARFLELGPVELRRG